MLNILWLMFLWPGSILQDWACYVWPTFRVEEAKETEGFVEEGGGHGGKDKYHVEYQGQTIGNPDKESSAPRGQEGREI